MNDFKKAIDIKILNYIELEYKIKFPLDFREHILKFNGGTPKANIISFNENGRINETDLRYFYAFGTKDYDDFEKSFIILKINDKRMPTNIFPIGEDSLGNQICISFGMEDYNSIYLWDHEKEVDYSVSDDTDYSNLYLIAKNFKEFIGSLKNEN